MERWGIKSPHDNNIEQADDSQELISTESFGTSMSTHRILGLKKIPRVRLFADKSGTWVGFSTLRNSTDPIFFGWRTGCLVLINETPSGKDWRGHSFVREDQEWGTSGVPVVAPAAPLGSYAPKGEPLKAYQVGNPVLKQVSSIVEDYYEIGKGWKCRETTAYLY